MKIQKIDKAVQAYKDLTYEEQALFVWALKLRDLDPPKRRGRPVVSKKKTVAKKSPGRPRGSKNKAKTVKPSPSKKRTISDAGRKRIAAAQKKRWADQKNAK